MSKAKEAAMFKTFKTGDDSLSVNYTSAGLLVVMRYQSKERPSGRLVIPRRLFLKMVKAVSQGATIP